MVSYFTISIILFKHFNKKILDGEVDCRDGSDEINCPTRICSPGNFQCNNSRCLYVSQLCNGADNCGDGSDEKPCQDGGCLPGRYQCPTNKKCIPVGIKFSSFNYSLR